jgi:hypothetical protein
MLPHIMEIIRAAGTQMALQSHVVYPEAVAASDGINARVSLKRRLLARNLLTIREQPNPLDVGEKFRRITIKDNY